jgi:PDZ domain
MINSGRSNKASIPSAGPPRSLPVLNLRKCGLAIVIGLSSQGFGLPAGRLRAWTGGVLYASAAMTAPKTSPDMAALPANDSGAGFDSAQSQANPATAEIPQAASMPSQASSMRAPAAPEPAATQSGGIPDYSDGVIQYEQARTPELGGPPVRSLQDFMSEGDITSPLGIEVREDRRKLKTGEDAQGLLIVDVIAGSPAARAGLHPYRRATRDVLETVAVAGALFFPPAVLLVPAFDQVHVGDTYDLIIGVDGSRVTNFLDFEDRLREVQPGEIVYFSVIRNGERRQIRMQVPTTMPPPAF